jgi:hypothetical protein
VICGSAALPQITEEVGGNNAHQHPAQQRSTFTMSFKTTIARLAGQRGPGTGSRIPVVIGAIGAALAGLTVAAGPALADTPQFTGTAVLKNVGAVDSNNGFKALCLDANSQEAHIFGGIIQWDCNLSDAYQAWTFDYAGNGQYLLQDQGTGLCADADADNAGTGGSVIQWTCSPADPFQLFYITDTGGGNLSIKSVGASNKTGTPICLDADFYTQYEFGNITQYPCNTSDAYQLWSSYHGSR